MKLLSLILSAVMVYVVVAACMLWPSDATGQQSRSPAPGIPGYRNPFDDAKPKRGSVSLEGLPYRAATIQVQRPDWIEKYKESIDEIAAVGADTLKIVVDARQENGKSSRIYLDLRMTPTPEALSELIQHAKKKNLRVILMPIVLLDAPVGGEWRGNMQPLLWDEWWESYRAMLGHFSWIAQANGVDVLVIGSELVSTETNVKEWTRTINHVRDTFKGRLTYSANWDHYREVKFWDQLDMIGMNSYWKMTKDGKKGDAVTVEEINGNWQDIQKDLLPWVKKTGKPLLFLEIGWFSQANAAMEPWDYTQAHEPLDLELQARLYEAFFQSWHGQPLLGGFSIWEWSPGDGGPKDMGYTPENKPAEKVLRSWLARDKWEVKLN